MQNGKKRWLTWSLVFLTLALLLVWGLRPKREQVEVAAVERGLLQVTLDEEGETRVRDLFVVSAPVAGRLLRIDLEPGDPVQGGITTLATFQPQRPIPLDARSRAEADAEHLAAHASLEQARAERDRFAADLSFARTEGARYRRLAAEGVVSAERAEAADLETQLCEDGLDGAEHAVEVAAHRLAAAEARLIESGDQESGEGLSLHSPIDGVVLRQLRESESVVPAGEPLLVVGDPRDIEIVADFLSSDAVRIEPGDIVLIERWGGEHELHGRVRRIEPSGFTKVSALGVEEQRVNVIVDVEDPPEARHGLADGFRVELRVVVWEADGVLTAPVGSVFRSDDGWAVYIARDGRARLQAVELGQRGSRRVEITSGIAEGDLLVLHPGDDIADGVKVELPDG